MALNLKKYFATYLITFLISTVAGIALFLVLLFVNNSTMYAAINASSISAVILLSFGGLMFVANEGFFDIFSYGFKQLGSSMLSKKANENNNFAEYKEQNRAKRISKPKIYISILTSGIIFLIAMIVLRIVELAN